MIKIVTKENLERFQAGEISKQQLQQLAFAIDSVASHSKTFTVDISNYEFCGQKEEREIEGFPIYVYTPIAIIYEKLRAICQQLPEYQKYVGTKKNAPRPRDFFDIFSVLEKHSQLDPAIYKKLYEERNLIDLANIFSLKKVPLQFLARIRDQQDYHEQDFVSVKDTVDQSKVRLEDFSFYFYFTVQIAEKLLEELTRLSILDNTASID